MIVNVEREPDLSLYYLGGILLEILEQTKVLTIEELLYETQNKLKKKLRIDFFVLCIRLAFFIITNKN